MSVFQVHCEFDTTRPRIALDGEWGFSYDPGAAGEAEGWFEPGHAFAETITVPGCAQARRYESAGSFERDTDVYIPEHSQTIMLKYGCMSASWYQRRFPVPKAWRAGCLELHLAGVKPAATVWLNGRELGRTLSSRSPLRLDITEATRPGEENTLTLRIDWPEVRLDGDYDILHAWSGIYRSVWIEAAPATRLTDIFVQPSTLPPAAGVSFTVQGELGAGLRARCDITDNEGQETLYSADIALEPDANKGRLTIDMPGAAPWSPRTPNLYRATLTLLRGDETIDSGSIRFGLREVATRGHQILLNGEPIFLRGAGDALIFPETVCPPADKTVYLGRIAKAKKYGYNYTKAPVEIFPPEFLEAADELGFLVCQELPFGCRELRAERGNPRPELSELWQHELRNIVTACRNHPSVALYSMASELELDTENPLPFHWFSEVLPGLARELHPGALVIDVTGGSCPGDTRHGRRDTDIIEDQIAGQADELTPLHGPLNVPEAVSKPFILHEWNWTASLPHPDILERYRDVALAPVQIPEMIEKARERGVEAELPLFAEKSRLLKHALRKDAFERAYAHPKVAGYHNWLVHDICYCPEGVFNEFWEEPADLPAAEYRTYNDDTVLALLDGDRRSFYYGQEPRLGLVVAHFGESNLAQPRIEWRLNKGGAAVANGTSPLAPIAVGERATTASLGVPPIAGDTAAAFELVCELRDGEKKVCFNHWNLWLFPKIARPVGAGMVTTQPLPRGWDNGRKCSTGLTPPPDTDVFITHRLAVEPVLKFLEEGGRVLLLSGGILQEAESVQYRTVAYSQGSVGNMGTIIYPHPALGDFPHQGWCDFAFIDMIQGAYPISLDAFLPARVEPIVRSIGHQVTLENKAYLFEAAVGEGVLLACSLNLQPHCHVDPAAEHLLYNLLRYLQEGEPKPKTVLSPEGLRGAVRRG